MKRIFGLFNFISLLLFGFRKKEEIAAFLPAFLLPEYPVVTNAEYKRTPSGSRPGFFRQLIGIFISGKGICQPSIPRLKTADSKLPGNTSWRRITNKIPDQRNRLTCSLDLFLHRTLGMHLQKFCLPWSGISKPAGGMVLHGSRKGDRDAIKNNWLFPDKKSD